MPDDKIVAAEKSILDIAAELKRLRDAAHLLNGAQAQVDAVLAAAQGVNDATRDFTLVCGPIVSKLASSDIIAKLDELELRHKELKVALEAVGGKVQAGDEQVRAAMQAAIDTLSGRLAQANLSDFGNLNAGLAAAVAGFREQMQEVRLEIVSAVQAAAALVVDGAVERDAAAIQRASEIQTLLAEMQAFIKISDGRFVQFELASKRRELLLLVLVSISLLALMWLVFS